jgi:hypothetical protein
MCKALTAIAAAGTLECQKILHFRKIEKIKPLRNNEQVNHPANRKSRRAVLIRAGNDNCDNNTQVQSSAVHFTPPTEF